MENIYLIHDNGGRPFKVVIKENDVSIYIKSSYNDTTDEIIYSIKPNLTI